MNRAEMLARLKAGEDALELSIEKWQDIVDGKGENLGQDNCALCKLFLEPDETEHACEGCPVLKRTGRTGCDRTPFHRFADAQDEDDVVTMNRLAKEELAFLKSLRKAEKGIKMEKVTGCDRS